MESGTPEHAKKIKAALSSQLNSSGLAPTT